MLWISFNDLSTTLRTWLAQLIHFTICSKSYKTFFKSKASTLFMNIEVRNELNTLGNLLSTQVSSYRGVLYIVYKKAACFKLIFSTEYKSEGQDK